MATYVIGDIHGCFATLEDLLAKLPLDPDHDRLWQVGDLVNRGPHSLEVLRWAYRQSGELGERFVCVLGNHDVHLLARAAGLASAKNGDTLEAVLQAPDRRELLAWLRSRPLLHADTVGSQPIGMVHAGLAPQWSWSDAVERAGRVEQLLVDDDRLLERHPTPDEPKRVSRARDDLQYFVRVRMCDDAGRLVDWNGPPAGAPAGAVPWFESLSSRASADRPTLLFGHWAALGLHLPPPRGTDGEATGARTLPRVLGLDSGCVWGGPLSALRLEDERLFQVPRR